MLTAKIFISRLHNRTLQIVSAGDLMLAIAKQTRLAMASKRPVTSRFYGHTVLLSFCGSFSHHHVLILLMLSQQRVREKFKLYIILHAIVPATLILLDKTLKKHISAIQLNQILYPGRSTVILEHVSPNEVNYLTEIILGRDCQSRVLTKGNFPATHFSRQQHKVKLVSELLMHRSPLSMGD